MSRLHLSAVVLALLLATPPASATNPTIETSLGKTFTLKVDLGFKLPCKHNYTLLFTDPSIAEEVKPKELTSSTNFKLRATRVGMTSVTAMFMGPGGNCIGSAQSTVDIAVMPDQKFTEKSWKLEVKSSHQAYEDFLDGAADDFDNDLDAIMEGFALGALDSGEAADQIADLVSDSTLAIAWAGYLSLNTLGDTGTDLLDDGGFTETLPSFQTGSSTSLWDDEVYDVEEDYDDWVSAAYEESDKALFAIALARGDFRATSYFDHSLAFEMPDGPHVATDPVDVPAAHTNITGGVAWNDGGKGALHWMGTGLLGAGDVKVDVFGPTGFAPQTLTVPQTAVDVGSPFGKWSLSLDSLSLTGIYRLEVRYASEDEVADKVSISLSGVGF